MGVIYILLSLGIALFLYRLRGLHPFRYGLGEMAVGIAAIYFSFYPASSAILTKASSEFGMALSHGVTLIGGIYLLVRGMDNVERDLPYGWRRQWARIFPKR